MANDIRPRGWQAAIQNRQPDGHSSAIAERMIRRHLELQPDLEGVDLRADWVREAIRDEVNGKLRFSPDGSSFVGLAIGDRVMGGDEDTVLRQLSNSLGVRIAAAAAQERPTELTPVAEVAAKLKKSGVYGI